MGADDSADKESPIDAFWKHLLQSTDESEPMALKDAKNITGTSLLLRDSAGGIYKHVDQHSNREPNFYTAVLISYMVIEAARFEKHQKGTANGSINGEEQNSKNNAYSFGGEVRLNGESKEARTCYTEVWHLLQRNASLAEVDIRDLNGANSTHTKEEMAVDTADKVHTPAENDFEERKLHSIFGKHLEILNSFFYGLHDSEERNRFIIGCLECLEKVLRVYSGEELRVLLPTMWQLRKLEILPDFLGTVFAYQQDCNKGHKSGWTLFNELDNGGVVKFLKMNNMFFGFSNPAVLDIKIGNGYIGQHPQDPGFFERLSCSAVCIERRQAIVDAWRKKKRRIRNSYNHSESCKLIQGIGASALGFDENNDIKDPRKFQDLLKSWRQEAVVKATTQKTLGFRICGCSFTDENGEQKSLATTDGMHMSDELAAMWIFKFFKQHKAVAVAVCHKLMLLRNWLLKQPFFHFYATSVVIGYDQRHPQRCDMRWVDFSHAIARRDTVIESSAPNPYEWGQNGHRDGVDAASNNSSLVWGLNNLLEIIQEVAHGP